MGGLLIQYDWCPYIKGKFGHRHTHTGRAPCEDEGRDQGDAATSQGAPRIAADHRSQARRMEQGMNAGTLT